jgi:hypothetical protein
VTVDEILQRLDGVKREKPGQWAARCPAHEDGSPSLAVKQSGDGKILLHCLAGCRVDDVLKALHLEPSDLFPDRQVDHARAEIAAVYPYVDEHGELLYEAVRLIPKSFRQRRPDPDGGWLWSLEANPKKNLSAVRRVLYRMPEILGDKTGRSVFVVEGEKEVDSVRGLGFLATCCSGGAKAWKHVAALASEVLKGRHVVVIPDNDEPGREYAAQVVLSLRGVAKSIRVLELPGLAEKGDVSDWIRDGGTPEKLTELARAATDARPELKGIDIGTFGERLRGEREERLSNAARLVPFDHAFLDDALGGLLPNDLLLLTAKSGAGKTQQVSMFAESAVRRGRRVLGFFLEAVRREIERRLKWRTLAQYWLDTIEPIRRQRRLPPLQLSYGAWMRGQLDVDMAAVERDVERWLSKEFDERLITVYRSEKFTLEQTERVMVAMQDEVDLFVLDHLDMVDFDDDGKSENAAARAIVERLRYLAVHLGKPVILVVHLKKPKDFRPSLVPQQEDIYGSSHVVKLATCAVSMAPAERANEEWWIAPTYMQVIKNRIDGDSRLVARVPYDLRMGMYLPTYELGRVVRGDKGEDTWRQLDDQYLPIWAQRATRKNAQMELEASR